MKKTKKMDLVKQEIINLAEKFVPEIEQKKHFGKKFIKSIPDSVILAHLAYELGYEDSSALDPLLFFIPALSKDPCLAAYQLVDAIVDYVDNVDSCSPVDRDKIDEFLQASRIR